MNRRLLPLLLTGALTAPVAVAAPQAAFMQPVPGLDVEERMAFVLGEAIFSKIWVQAPSSTTASDGLGPLYNARSCRQCHIGNGRGRPPADPTDPSPTPSGTSPSALLRLSIPARSPAQQLVARHLGVVPDPVYGTQLQTFAISGLRAEGKIGLDYTTERIRLADGTPVELRKPQLQLTDPGYGAPAQQLQLSLRIAPPMIGLGLLARIPEQQLLQRADPEDRDGDGISGRPNRVWDRQLGQPGLGRFGWKAGQPSLAQQNASALAGDIGIGNAYYPEPQGDCTEAQRPCIEAPNGNTAAQGGHEASEQMLTVLEQYTARLRAPDQRNAQAPLVRQGYAVFNRIGCQRCHTEYQVSEVGSGAQSLRPFTDLLLHDMGAGLADDRPEFDASASEWRTPPLWGLGLSQTVNGNSYYLHDGRARTLLEALLWHGGEASASRNRVISLPTAEREALIHFLESL